MEQEKTIKCIKCNKDIAMQEGVKTPKGVMCKSCQKKGKSKQSIIALAVLLLLVVGGYTYYQQSQKNSTIGFGGVAGIQDSTQVITEKPIEIFKLEVTVAQSNPVVVGQTIDNIESFKSVLADNIKKAEQDKAETLFIPNINILFSLSSHEVAASAKELIAEYAKAYLQTNKQATILVEGYACDLGSVEVNDCISKQRAESVKSLLVLCGISESNVKTQWYGKSKNKNFTYPTVKDYRRVTLSIK